MIKKLLCVLLCLIMSCLFMFTAAAEDEYDNCITVHIKPEYSGTGKCYTAQDFDIDGIDYVDTFISEWSIPQWKNDVVFIYVNEPFEENKKAVTEALLKDEKTDNVEDGRFDIYLLEISIGDADGDNRVTDADARLLMRMAVGLDEIPENLAKYCIDMDHDGEITVNDARLAMRTAVGLDRESKFEYFL